MGKTTRDATAIAANMQQLGQEQHERKESAEAEVAKAGGGGFLRGSDWS
jgi:hypothetical protein